MRPSARPDLLATSSSTDPKLVRRLFFSVFLGLTAWLVGGCVSATTNVPPERRSPQPFGRLGAGDILKITYAIEETQAQTVQTVKIPPDGRLNLPYIKAEVNAIDQTPTTLQKLLNDCPKNVKGMDVIVTLEESAKRVYVTGALKAAIPLEHPMTVSQIVAAAGGAPEESLGKPMILTCIENGKVVSYRVMPNDPAPVYVRPGDEIRVTAPQF